MKLIIIFIWAMVWTEYLIFLVDRYKRGSNRQLDARIDILQGVFWITTAMLSWSDALKYRVFYLVMAALSFAVVAYRIVRGKNGIKKT